MGFELQRVFEAAGAQRAQSLARVVERSAIEIRELHGDGDGLRQQLVGWQDAADQPRAQRFVGIDRRPVRIMSAARPRPTSDAR